jgi:hypothetical protein
MGAVTSEAESVVAKRIDDQFGMNSDSTPAIGVEQTIMANNAQ